MFGICWLSGFGYEQEAFPLVPSNVPCVVFELCVRVGCCCCLFVVCFVCLVLVCLVCLVCLGLFDLFGLFGLFGLVCLFVCL